MIGRVEETSASFEARSAPRSHPTTYGSIASDQCSLRLCRMSAVPPKADKIRGQAAFSVGRFGSRPVERPFHKFDGIDCRPELDAKIVDRLLHRHRQFPPPVDNAAHR